MPSKRTTINVNHLGRQKQIAQQRKLAEAFLSLNLQDDDAIIQFMNDFIVPFGDKKGMTFAQLGRRSWRPYQKAFLEIIEAIDSGQAPPKIQWEKIQNALKKSTHISYAYDVGKISARNVIAVYKKTTLNNQRAILLDAVMQFIEEATTNNQPILVMFNQCRYCGRSYHPSVRKSIVTCSDICTYELKRIAQNQKRKK